MEMDGFGQSELSSSNTFVLRTVLPILQFVGLQLFLHIADVDLPLFLVL